MQDAVVIDNGSAYIKAGISTDIAPSVIFPTKVGTLKPHILEDEEEVASKQLREYYVGEEAFEQRNYLRISNAVERGVFVDSEAMARVWEHAFVHLQANPADHPVLLTEVSFNSQPNREKMAQTMFERFGIPALYVAVQGPLVLYSCAKTTGVVVDVGDGVTQIVPIFEGVVLEKNKMFMKNAGRDMTEYLGGLLERKGHIFQSVMEKEALREIKEKVCRVALDFKEETKKENVVEQEFQLPDGSTMTIGSEAVRCPEVLFRPEMVSVDSPGVHELTFNSIVKSDIDLRKEFYANIVLAGGSTLFDGFAARMTKELVSLAPSLAKVEVDASPDRGSSVWVGGAMLSSLSIFHQNWVTKKEYEESGASAIHRCAMTV